MSTRTTPGKHHSRRRRRWTVGSMDVRRHAPWTHDRVGAQPHGHLSPPNADERDQKSARRSQRWRARARAHKHTHTHARAPINTCARTHTCSSAGHIWNASMAERRCLQFASPHSHVQLRPVLPRTCAALYTVVQPWAHRHTTHTCRFVRGGRARGRRPRVRRAKDVAQAALDVPQFGREVGAGATGPRDICGQTARRRASLNGPEGPRLRRGGGNGAWALIGGVVEGERGGGGT